MLGVDIYRYQTVTDWRRFAESVKYTWVKLTDGYGPAVVRGDRQVNGCKSVGVPVGGYHYAQFGDAVAQARVFLGEVRRLSADDLAPALDLEAPYRPDDTARNFGVAFCREVARQGYRPAVYMSASWAGSLRPDRWGIPDLVIWVAAYGRNDGRRDTSAVSRYYPGRYDVHQYTSRGAIFGVSGDVDLNWSYGVPHNTRIDEHTEVEDMTPEQDRKLTELWEALLPGEAGRKSSGVMADYLRRAMLAAEGVAGRLSASEARVLAAIKTDTVEVDVTELAEALRDNLGSEIAEAIGRKLTGQDAGQ